MLSFASDDAANEFINYITAFLFDHQGQWPLLFKVYNYGILACLISVLSFSILYGVATLAGDGSGFARKINAWVYIRSLAGAVLLVPIGNSDYALIQHFVLKIVWWSVWFASYVFSNIAITSALPMDTIELRLKNDGINSSYTQMVSMGACALTYAPDMMIDTEFGKMPLSFKELSNTVEKVTYGFEGISECGFLELPEANVSYIAKMTEVLNSLKSIGRALSNSAQIFFDQAQIQAEATGRDLSTDPLYIDTLCSPFGLGSSCLSGAQDASSCWSKETLQLTYRNYSQLMSFVVPTGSSNDSLSLLTLLSDFYMVEEYILNNTASQSASYVVPTFTQATPKPQKNWQNDTETTLPADVIEASSTEAQRLFNIHEASDTLNGRDLDSFVQAQLIVTRRNVAKNETKSQIYRLLFNEISSFSDNWIDKDKLPMSGLDHYIGSDDLRDHIQTTIGNIKMPRSNPDRAFLPPLNIHVIQESMDKMIQNVLGAITGCSKSECAGTTGLIAYQNGTSAKTPINFIRDMGLKILMAGVDYRSDAILGEDGVIRLDDKLGKKVYASTTGTLLAAVGAESAMSVYPITSWSRAGQIILYGVGGSLIETWGYLADLDQYALYKYEPLGSAISTIFMIWGALFSVFLPAVPYLILMFSLIGWIFIIIEAMIASPLVALGLTHPSTHQFLGASDQTLMMFFLLALRPVTIMIATCMAMFLSKNAIFFLNEGILRFMEFYFAGIVASKTATSVEGVILLMSVMMIYSYVVFIVLIQSFSIIGMLPDKIGSWIGVGPMGGINPLQQVLALRTQFESGAQQASQGGTGSGKARRDQHSSNIVRTSDLFSAKKTGERQAAWATGGGRINKVLDKVDGGNKKAGKVLEKGLTGNSRMLARQIIRSDMSRAEKISALRQIRRSVGLHGLMGSAGSNFGFGKTSMSYTDENGAQRPVSTGNPIEFNAALEQNGITRYKLSTGIENVDQNNQQVRLRPGDAQPTSGNIAGNIFGKAVSNLMQGNVSQAIGMALAIPVTGVIGLATAAVIGPISAATSYGYSKARGQVGPNG
jgi:hypothetical protein